MSSFLLTNAYYWITPNVAKTFENHPSTFNRAIRIGPAGENQVRFACVTELDYGNIPKIYAPNVLASQSAICGQYM